LRLPHQASSSEVPSPSPSRGPKSHPPYARCCTLSYCCWPSAPEEEEDRGSSKVSRPVHTPPLEALRTPHRDLLFSNSEERHHTTLIALEALSPGLLSPSLRDVSRCPPNWMICRYSLETSVNWGYDQGAQAYGLGLGDIAAPAISDSSSPSFPFRIFCSPDRR
jgi:hypothetical protein